MSSVVSLLAAAALLLLQSRLGAGALLDNKLMDNNINSIVVPRGSARRPPKFVSIQQPPPAAARLAGAPLPLRCEAMGVPAPSVRWLKNGEPVQDYFDESNEITAVYLSSMAWLLSTLVVTAAADGDEFTCVASTGFATETASTTVYTEPGDTNELHPPLFTMAAPPVISTYYIQLFQDIGTNAVLPCRVFSPSEPQVYWQDKHHNVVHENSRMRVLPSGDLFIAGIRWSDMGEYTCTAKNMYGETSATTFLYPARPKH